MGHRAAHFALMALAFAPALLSDAARGEERVEAPALAVEEIVVVAARLPRPVEDVLGNVEVISRDELVETLVLRPADAVRYTPGVSLSRADHRFGDTGFTIRGLSGNRITTLIDRVPVPDAFSVGSFSNAGQEFLAPDAISRIEILRGPASTLFGSDALGGVVAVVTRSPEELLRGEELGAATFLGYSGADDGRTIGATGAARFGDISTLLHASGSLGEELDASAASDTDSLDRSRASILGKAEYALPWGDVLRFKAEHFSEQVDSDLDAILGYGRQFADTTQLRGDDEREQTSLVLGLDFEPPVLADFGVLDLYWHRSHTRQITDELRATAAPPVAIERRFDYRYEDLGLLLDLERTVRVAGIDNRIGWGLSLRGSDIEEKRDGSLLDLETGESSKSLLGEELPVRDFPDSRILEVGVYGHDEIEFGPVTVLPGLRFESYDLDARSDALYRADNPTTQVVDVHETAWVPKLGLLYRPDEGLEFFAQYSRGFRAPPFEDVNIGLDLPRFNIRAIPNPDLEAETSDGIEIGARFRSDRLRARIAVFGATYDDFIASKVPLGPDPQSGVLIFQSQNIDEARIYGLEFDVEASLDEWVRGLSMQLGGSWLRGENRVTDDPLDTVDPPELVTRLRWAPHPVISGALAVTAVAKQPEVDSSEIDPFVPDGYVALDLFVSVQPMPRLRIDAGLFNLTDEDYWRWSSIRGRPEDDPLVDLLSEPGRHVSVSVHLSL